MLILLQDLDRIYVNLKVYTPVMVPDSSLLESSPKGLEYDIYAFWVWNMIQMVGQGSKYKYKGGLRSWVLEWSLGRQKEDKKQRWKDRTKQCQNPHFLATNSRRFIFYIYTFAFPHLYPTGPAQRAGLIWEPGARYITC